MKGFAYVVVRLLEESHPTVIGYGVPFANLSDAKVEGWVNGNKPVVEDFTSGCLTSTDFLSCCCYARRTSRQELRREPTAGPLQLPVRPFPTEHL
jgi:hypothetical protein